MRPELGGDRGEGEAEPQSIFQEHSQPLSSASGLGYLDLPVHGSGRVLARSQQA